MKNTLRRLLTCALLACLCGGVLQAQAQDSEASAGQGDRQIVSVGHGANLPAGESAEQVVSVFGSTKVDGDVSDAAVAVLGDVTVNGTVGDSAVAVLGDVYINGKVSGDVVAVLGNVKLGPQAQVGGQITEILGTLQRSPTAVVQGGTVHVLSGLFGNVEGLHAWFRDCLVYGRPLAPTLDVGWAWWLALGTLAFYILIAAIFQDGVRRCVLTLDAHPGPSILATVIAVLLVPVVMLALVITVVGIAVIPLFWIAVMCAGLFGRVIALGWLGSRCLRLARSGSATQPVLDVLIGGLIVLALYMVPILGFFLYMLLGAFGFGAVIYTILLATRSSSAPSARPPAAARPGTVSSTAAAAGAAGEPRSGSGLASDTAAGMTNTSAAGASTAASPPPPPPPPGAPAGNTVDILDVATLPRAGFWIRMLALLIDLILVGVALSWLHHGGRGMLLLLATYGAIMWKLKGTTVGGIVCDLKVVRIGGGPLDWGTAIVRALGCFLSLVVAGLGFIWIAVDHEHQAWHDKIAGTVVVRVPKGVGLV
ncbi:MAG TPA: RDD family protein [Steroidobacteraceae bacterium]|nr:RDD family protein [Steroidobacteraceae bacterium]